MSGRSTRTVVRRRARRWRGGGLRRLGGPASRGRRGRASIAASTSGPSNGASASTARRRTFGLSVDGGEDRRQPAASPIAPSAAAADSRTSASSASVASAISRSSVASSTPFAARRTPRPRPRPRSGRRRRAAAAARRRVASRRASPPAGARPAPDRRRRRCTCVVGERAEPRRARRAPPPARPASSSATCATTTSRVAAVPGDDDPPAPLDRRSSLEQVGEPDHGHRHAERHHDRRQRPRTAMPIPPLATAASSRRTTPGRRYSGVSRWSTATPGAGPVSIDEPAFDDTAW